MQSLLQRQLKKFFGRDTDLPEALKGFVAAVNESYTAFDHDRALLHRAMELSSEELTKSNSELRAVFQAIPDLILRLDRAGNIVTLKATTQAEADPEADRFSKRRVSRTILEIPNPAVREQFQAALAALFRDRQPQSFEYSLDSEFGPTCFEARLIPLLEENAIAIIQDITQRKQVEADHERLNQQLISASRQAGMAEVATGVLHNVGNVLNSVNVSACLLRDNLRKSQIQNLVKATHLLRDHATDAVAFLTNDPKGQRLPDYLIKLGDHLAAEQRLWQQELEDLGHNLEHIKEIVAMQQSHARSTGVAETIQPEDLVTEALRMNEAVLEKHGVRVVREWERTPPVRTDRHKVLQILINLIQNARDAMAEAGLPDKILTITIRATTGPRVRIQVADNGVGITAGNLVRIFQHGFTTKRDGHGFGLHSSANAAREVKGNLSVNSFGPGHGTTFTLELPAAEPGPQAPSKTLSPTEIANHHEI